MNPEPRREQLGPTTPDPVESSWPGVLASVLQCRDHFGLAKLARRARALARTEAPPGVPVRVSLLGGPSTVLIEDALHLALVAAGIAPTLATAAHGQFVSELLREDSATASFAPQIAVVLVGPHDLPEWPEAGASPERAKESARRVARWLIDAGAALWERTGAEIVLNTIPPIPERPFGHLTPKTPGARNNFIRRVNVALGDVAPDFVHLLDLQALVERIGLDSWFDARLWYEARQPLSPRLVPTLARHMASVIAARFGRAKKAIILDLDNTLWGGVVGERGLEGIEIGEGTPRGEAFRAFQIHLKGLASRGVLLAVASKNDEHMAQLPFREHPDMVLALDDFVAFEAHWEPKSTSVARIASRLKLGLDALVFVDDNPAEREEVRTAHPEVAIPELPNDPAAFVSVLDDSGWFESIAVTAEDRRRSDSYKFQVEAAAIGTSGTSYADFLRSLEMRARIAPFQRRDLARITQLVNKTNQFNSTTRRLTSAQVEELARDPAAFTRAIRLADRLGDHGLIGVLWGRGDADALIVEGWLMSCRVFERGVEDAVMDEVVAAAREQGRREVRVLFVPSPRNARVRDLLERLRFSAAGESAADATETWCLALAQYRPRDVAIAIRKGPLE